MPARAGNDFSKGQIHGFGSTQPSLALRSKSGDLEWKCGPGGSLAVVALVRGLGALHWVDYNVTFLIHSMLLPRRKHQTLIQRRGGE